MPRPRAALLRAVVCVLSVSSATGHAFSVQSGPCALEASGSCVTSPGFPSNYPVNQSCAVEVLADGYLNSTAFETTEGRDVLGVNGTQYSGTCASVDQQAGVGDTLTWNSSNLTANMSGWRVCWSSQAEHGWWYSGEREALMDLSRSTWSTGWRHNTSWGSQANYCVWYGVGCCQGRVTKIDMDSNRLFGSIPSGISGLAQLSSLDLQSTTISGFLPSSLVSLTHLITLDVASSSVSGILPSALLALTKLETLHLSYTSISGSILTSFASLTTLTSIDLHHTSLSGTLPEFLASLTRLSSLILGPNSLSGVISAAFAKLTGLTTLDLQASSLSGTIPQEIGSLSSHTKTLSLLVNRLSGTIPSAVQSMTALVGLRLSQNQLSGTLPSWLASLSLLEAFPQQTNRLSGTIPSCLSSLTSLTSLALNNNLLSGTLPVALTSLSSVGTLSLWDNIISGTIPTQINKMSHLFILHLEECKISGTLPSQLGELPIIWWIATWGNPISGTFPPELFSARILRWLIFDNMRLSGTLPHISASNRIEYFMIYSNSISGYLPAAITNLTTASSLSIGQNRMSGTVPLALAEMSPLTQLGLDSNMFSGTIHSELSSLTRLHDLYIGGSLLSGTFPAEISSLTRLQRLAAADMTLSGTIPSSYAALTTLSWLHLANNKLSGSSSPNFANWTQLTLLSAFSNAGLDWDLSLLQHSPGLKSVLLQGNGITGTIPEAIGHASALETLLLHDNSMSGTLPLSLFASARQLQTVMLSFNRLSGSLPSTLTSLSRLKAFLANGMSLSGTLPAFGHHAETASTLETLSLAQNFLTATTDVLAQETNLRTLLLSSNYLSCNAVTLNGALNLGRGTFGDPGQEVLSNLAADVAIEFPAFDPFPTTVDRFENTVLVFAGNPQLTVSASYFPEESSGRLLQTDEIRNGRHGLFAGDSSAKTMAWLTLPALLLIHFAVVVLLTQAHNEPLLDYPQRHLARAFNTKSRSLQKAFRGVCVLGFVGLLLIVLHLVTPSIYDSGCADALLRTTVALVSAEEWYQWSWIILCCVVLVSTTFIMEQMHRSQLSSHARAVYRWIRLFAVQTLPPHLAALAVWRSKVPHPVARWRKVLAWLLHIPFLLFTSLPAIGFVLSMNVPSSRNLGLTLLRNFVVIAMLKMLWASLIIPSIAGRLGRFQRGVRDPTTAEPMLMITLHKTQVATALLFDVVTVLVAPIVSVAVLDESCMRGYLLFSPNLERLMSAWGLGQRGWEAYRPGMCTRRLIAEYFYVWFAICVLSALFRPSLWLLFAHPRVKAVQERLLGRLFKPKTSYAETLSRAGMIQSEVAQIMSLILMVIIFGPLVPPLLVLAPVAAWLQLCALNLVERHKVDRFWGQALAANVLVQVPLRPVRLMASIGMWTTTFLVALDLGFERGPVVFYAVFAVLEACVAAYRWQQDGEHAHEFRNRKPTSDYVCSVDFTHSGSQALRQINFATKHRNKPLGEVVFGETIVNCNPLGPPVVKQEEDAVEMGF